MLGIMEMNVTRRLLLVSKLSLKVEQKKIPVPNWQGELQNSQSYLTTTNTECQEKKCSVERQK